MLCRTKENLDYEHVHKFIELLDEAKTPEFQPEEVLLPLLLFHLLVWEHPEKDAEKYERLIAVDFRDGDNRNAVVLILWGLGPSSLRRELHRSSVHPFRHDIIGNTLAQT